MPDPHLSGWFADFIRYRTETVRCPHKRASATIMAAAWTLGNGRWTMWSIVDCSLMPAGCISCDAGCLAQLEAAATGAGAQGCGARH